MEEALYEWFLGAYAVNFPVTKPVLPAKAKQCGLLINSVDCQLGGGWVQRFKERHDIVCKAATSEQASLDVEPKQKLVEETLPRILDNCVNTDICNGNEKGLFFQMLLSMTHAPKGDRCKGGKNSKLCLIVFLCADRDRSNKCPTFVIGK